MLEGDPVMASLYDLQRVDSVCHVHATNFGVGA
jgi:hypothetical protein